MGAIDDDKSLVVSCYTNYPEQNKTILCTHHPQPQLFHLPSCSWPSTILKNQKYIPLIFYRGFLLIYDNEKPDQLYHANKLKAPTL